MTTTETQSSDGMARSDTAEILARMDRIEQHLERMLGALEKLANFAEQQRRDNEALTLRAADHIRRSARMRPSSIAITLALGAAINLTAIVATRADIRITNDSGGNVRAYNARVIAARASGEKVIIDGPCRSACGLWLNLPPSQICATPRGVFVFHTATTELGTPHPQTNDEFLRAMPPRVRTYILQRGGLWLNPITVRATQFVRRCP